MGVKRQKKISELGIDDLEGLASNKRFHDFNCSGDFFGLCPKPEVAGIRCINTKEKVEERSTWKGSTN